MVGCVIIPGDKFMQETPVMTATQPLEMGCISDREVITSDGRNIGTLTGAWIDLNTWTITSLIVELKKDVVEELNVKKPIMRTARVNIPTSYIKTISDVAQLNTDIATLSSAFATSQG
jgi:sporulation protein YlmC with PRC-barrel domain